DSDDDPLFVSKAQTYNHLARGNSRLQRLGGGSKSLSGRGHASCFRRGGKRGRRHRVRPDALTPPHRFCLAFVSLAPPALGFLFLRRLLVADLLMDRLAFTLV